MATAASRILGPAAVIVLLAGVGIGTWYFQPREPAIDADPAAVTAAPPPPRPAIAQVTNAARSLKLITWSFDTTLDARVVSDKWYGDARAYVSAPVRYQYGVDLGTLEPEDAFFDSAADRYVFLVRPPQRLSCEIDIAKLEQSLETSGLRWRSQNADKVDDARRALAAHAESLVLSPDDRDRLLTVSREQLESHLRSVLARAGGEKVDVVVRFTD